MATPKRGFQKGNKGKPKGAQNKITRTVKECVLAAFIDAQEDPKIKLSQFAKDYPKEFYQIAAKLIPTELEGNLKMTEIKVIRE